MVTMTESPLEKLEDNQLLELIDETESIVDLEAIVAGLEDELLWRPWSHQIPPDGDWTIWLLRGGRGSGKTDGGASWMNEHAKGPPCDPRVPGGHRMSIVGPTLGDVAESCVNGPSGLRAHNPDIQLVGHAIGGAIVRWPNGAEAKLFGGHTPAEVERFRAGGNRCACWIEEAAAIPQIELIVEQIPFGHRLGRHPRIVVTTTPKPRQFLKNWHAFARRFDEGLPCKRWQRVRLTTATTDDNPALDVEVREGLFDLYQGTRLGRQELLGEMLEDFEGALWHRTTVTPHGLDEPGKGRGVDDLRIDWADVPPLLRRYVGVDPSTWGLKNLDGRKIEEGELARGIETGIVASGIDQRRHTYTFRDWSKRCSPADWADRALDVYWGLWSASPARWRCSSIVFEVNAGGAMGPSIILAQEKIRRLQHGRDADELPAVRFYKSKTRVGVIAADSKRARAEPVSALSEQRRHHMVGELPLLEDQMCQWDPNESWSPDRIDALVWSVTALAPWKRATVVRGTSVAERQIA